MLALLICLAFLGLWSASAQADPSEPTQAEQRWIDAFYEFVETGEPGDGLIHEKRLVRESLRPFQLDAKQLQSFDSIAIGDRLLQGMWENMSESTWVTFIRMRDLEDGRVAQFRFHGDDGLSYIEWYMQPKPDGEVWAWDANVYVTGERFTETLRRLWLPAVAQLDEQVRKHMGKRNRELADHIMQINTMRIAANSGDHAKAIQIYEGFPQSVQEERVCIIYVMNSYYESGNEESYKALLEKFLQLHGEASNRELMLVDVYIYREQYDLAMQMVDDLDKRVGGDVFLESFRGSVAYLSGDYKKAKLFYDRGIQRDPSVEDFYWESIDYAMAEEDWERIGKMLDAVQEQGVELYRLSDVEGYEAFVASDEYPRWLARQPKEVQDVQNGLEQGEEVGPADAAQEQPAGPAQP